MLINEFNIIADWWMAALDQYDLVELCTKPAPSQWSIGQLYLHLIDDTSYYLEQMEICLSAHTNTDKAMTAAARKLFDNNDFPDKQIIGHPDNDSITQPNSKHELREGLVKLKTTMNEMAARMSKTVPQGKARHPGFEYLDAEEWLQLACMHFRHHLRQKNRIDEFLKTEKPGP